ncbi:thiaminase II [Acuticoccus sediminis]|uniref:Thiaminase II n=1 Tax=Acuticoccus sediminis TaxID=2184697 RepID=A0A8B2NU43_9HYPH|nr:TenA family protein [Acuticoccus sediminis]RAI03718.1 thiaminase II [Acuticoccus sediminis]
MNFTANAWVRTEAAFAAIRETEFITELADGSLDRPTFEHYLVQDAHFIAGLDRALAIAAAKMPRRPTLVQFTDAAAKVMNAEHALQGHVFRHWAIDSNTFAQTPIAPACTHYVSFIIAAADAESNEVLMATILPSLWLYAELGRDLGRRPVADNPYQVWIDTYSSPLYQSSIAEMLAAVDAAAARASDPVREEMMASYLAAVQIECAFWDAAFRQQPLAVIRRRSA